MFESLTLGCRNMNNKCKGSLNVDFQTMPSLACKCVQREQVLIQIQGSEYNNLCSNHENSTIGLGFDFGMFWPFQCLDRPDVWFCQA